MIAMYDLDDNLIQVFDSYKDCAKYFNTSIECLRSYICRTQKGKVDKKRDTVNKKWCRLFKIENDEEAE